MLLLEHILPGKFLALISLIYSYDISSVTGRQVWGWGGCTLAAYSTSLPTTSRLPTWCHATPQAFIGHSTPTYVSMPYFGLAMTGLTHLYDRLYLHTFFCLLLPDSDVQPAVWQLNMP